MPKAPPCFYAVSKGRTAGVYTTWGECEAQVKGFNGAKFKKFANAADAEAFVMGIPTSGPSASTSNGTYTRTTSKKRGLSPNVEDESGWDVVYSDGACKGNGQPGSVAGVGVWWGKDDPRNIAERCPGDQTNNRAELIAILRILETTAISQKPLLIKTDSQYSINCFQNWLPKWAANNYRSSTGAPVKNVQIIRYLATHLDARARHGQKVQLQYVKGHSGEEGNEGADALANVGATKPAVPEREWEDHERELREVVEVQLKMSAEKARMAPIEAGVHEGGSVIREPVESPTKMRRFHSPDPAPDVGGSKSCVAKEPVISPPRVRKFNPPKSTLMEAGGQLGSYAARGPVESPTKVRKDYPLKAASMEASGSGRYLASKPAERPSEFQRADPPKATLVEVLKSRSSTAESPTKGRNGDSPKPVLIEYKGRPAHYVMPEPIGSPTKPRNGNSAGGSMKLDRPKFGKAAPPPAEAVAKVAYSTVPVAQTSARDIDFESYADCLMDDDEYGAIDPDEL